MKEFKIHAVETVSEWGKSEVKRENRDLCKTKKSDQKVKRIKKHSRTSPDVQFKEFSFTKQKN